jgi:chromosome segregation ATPase
MNDERKISLLPFIQFPYILFDKLKDFFQKFDLNNLTLQLWNEFLKLIYHSENQIQRLCYNEKTTYLCLEDYYYILKKFQTTFQSKEITFNDLFDRYELQVNEVKELHDKNQEFQIILNKIKEENSQIKQLYQQNQTKLKEQNKTIQDLEDELTIFKKENSNLSNRNSQLEKQFLNL